MVYVVYILNKSKLFICIITALSVYIYLLYSSLKQLIGYKTVNQLYTYIDLVFAYIHI